MDRHGWSAGFIVMVGIVIVGILGGCGEGEGAGSGEGPEAGPEEAESAAPTEEGTEVEEEGIETRATAPLDCEERGIPCSWAEVDPAVAERSRAVGEEGLDRVPDESPTKTLGWLTGQAGVVETGASVDSAALWFRMEGGRRVYIEGKTSASFDGAETGVPDPSRPGSASSGQRAVRELAAAGLHRAGLGDLLLPSLLRRASGNRRSHGAGVPVGSRASASAEGTSEAPAGLPESASTRLPAEASNRTAAGASTGPSAVHPAAVRARGVAGRDRNEDTEVDQRDQRRALVLDPLYWEFCYEFLKTEFPDEEEKRLRDQIVSVCEGEAGIESLGLEASDMYRESEVVKAELEDSNAYWGNVTVLKNEEVDFGTVASWPEYDVIHLASHGSADSWTFGKEVRWPRNGKWSSVPRTKGLDIWFARAGDHGPRKAVYSAGVDFFRTALPRGLHRSMLFISACNGLGTKAADAPDLVQHVIQGDAMFFGWSMTVGSDDAERAARGLYDVLSRGWPGRQALDSLPDEVRAPALQSSETKISFEDILLVGSGFLGRWGANLRIREIPELLHPQSVLLGMEPFPLKDGHGIVTLLDGLPGDGEEDLLSVVVEVDAVTRERAHRTTVQLELDGRTVGEPRELSLDEEVRPQIYRKEFEDVPLELDIQLGEEYELAAVVKLQEGGESRYAADLLTEECVVPANGTYEGTLGGPVARVVEPKRGSGLAKLRPRSAPEDPTGAGHPLGDWHLQLDSRVKWGDDLDLAVYFDGPPEVGQYVLVHDAGLLDAAITGGVEEPKRVDWDSGTVRILFTGVTEEPGSGARGYCGEISAELIGYENPWRSMNPPPIPGSFNGKFRAVWDGR